MYAYMIYKVEVPEFKCLLVYTYILLGFQLSKCFVNLYVLSVIWCLFQYLSLFSEWFKDTKSWQNWYMT